MMNENLSVIIREAVGTRYEGNVPLAVSDRIKEECKIIEQKALEKDYIRAYNIINQLQQLCIPWIVNGDSSLVSFLLGITQVNPLPAHYYCPKCKKVEFVPEHKSGFDLPERICDFCGTTLHGDGQQIDVAWFASQNPQNPTFSDYHVPGSSFPTLKERLSNCDLPILYDQDSYFEDPHITFISATDTLNCLQWLCKKTGISEQDIPANDPAALNSLFTSLGKEHITDNDIARTTGLCLSEGFQHGYQRFKVRAKAASVASQFSDLIQYIGMIHGTINGRELPLDVWSIVCDRDSVLEYLYQHEVPKDIAISLARRICLSHDKTGIESQLDAFGIDQKIQRTLKRVLYLFPRVQIVPVGVLYVRLSWFNLHYQDEYQQAIELFLS